MALRTRIAASIAALVLAPAAARADEMIIESPGQHRHYVVEIEPHADLAIFDVGRDVTGFGLGGRFSFPVVQDGFVDSINNSVAIGAGLDWLSYSGCYGLRFGDCSNISAFWVPVVLQWNFYLSKGWSVFGEPGLSFSHVNYGDNCADTYVNDQIVTVDCGGGSKNRVRGAFWAGGRWHFSESKTLTMRLGFDYWTVGVSFL